jgi:hypothetical protein
MDQYTPAMLSRPIPVFDIHTGVVDRPSERLAGTERERHADPKNDEEGG